MKRSSPNLEAERGLLSIMLQGVDPAPAITQIAAKDFVHTLHRRLFACLKTMIENGEPLLLPAVHERMELDGDETAQLAALLDPLLCVRTGKELVGYVRTVKSRSRERDLRFAIEEASNGNGDLASHLMNIRLAGDLWESDQNPSADSLFQAAEDFEGEHMLSFSIENFLQNHAITGIGGLSGHGKTFVMLSMAKALLAGPPTKLWGLFPVVERASTVIYLIPESTLGPFKHRLKLMGLYDEVFTGRLLTRTLEKGPLDLTDKRLLAAVKDAYVFLDTAVRFMSGDENKAEDNRSFAFEVFGLLKAGARAVVAAYHSPKGFRKESVMDLEGALRGGGDLGAALATCWAVKQIDVHQNLLHIENVKPRDFEPPGPFQLLGRPCIDQQGDFALYKMPGDCGPLAEEAPPPGGAPQGQREAKAANKELVRTWLEADPSLTNAAIVGKFRTAGIQVNKSTVSRYRKELEL